METKEEVPVVQEFCETHPDANDHQPSEAAPSDITTVSFRCLNVSPEEEVLTNSNSLTYFKLMTNTL